MDELKLCPFCGSVPEIIEAPLAKVKFAECKNPNCPLQYYRWLLDEEWQTRPVEDALKAEIAKLRAELEQERDKNRWIPMEVEPKEGLYLLINKRWKKYKNYMLIEFDDFTGWQTYYPASFSHYMPLPAPPEAQE